MEKKRKHDLEPGWMSLPQVAAYTGLDYKRVREAVKREMDPLPARMYRENRKRVIVMRKELDEWMLRQCPRVN